MSKLKELHSEYLELKEEIFKGHSFIEVESNASNKRYDQLFAFFHPQFRTKKWINPFLTFILVLCSSEVIRYIIQILF